MDLAGLMERQREIVRALDCPLFVSAGAGSGKTFTLTRRILWALSERSGPYLDSLDQVLAITFTRDAAQEIRERVRAALIEEGMRTEALAIDDAWISTIHGMCARMLRAHALELGIDPEFSILQDTDELMDAAVEHVLVRAELASKRAVQADSQAAADTEGAWRGLHELVRWYPPQGEMAPDGREAGTSLRKLVRRLLELSSALPAGMDSVHLARGYADTASLADAYRPLLDATPAASRIAKRALDALERFESSEHRLDDLVSCMMACEVPSHASKVFSSENIAALKAEIAETFVNGWLFCGTGAIDALAGLARDVEDEYRALKGRRSLLDNNDLLRLTWRALRDNETFKAAYQGRFRLVMIDEFQDTDQLQVDLIDMLVGQGCRALCTVGDAQQSIYRFRGAEVEVFRRREREMRLRSGQCGKAGETVAALSRKDGDARLVELVRNFRSHADILAFVKQVFDGSKGGLMADFLDLEAHDDRRNLLVPSDATRCRAVLVAGGGAPERAEARAEAIAARFQALAQGGQPAADMVILLGKMTWADTYARALRSRGLSAVIAGGSVFAGTIEARSVRALARALANPADGADGLVPALCSPLFGLGAQELLALATAVDPKTGEISRRGVEVGLMSDEDASGLSDLPLVRRARDIMRGALRRVGRDPFAGLMRDVVNESGWMTRLAARGPEGTAAAANVLKALDAIEQAEGRVGNAPRLITRELDRFMAGKQAPGVLNERGGDAVRIMTVHASKGLEFPVVAVADCFGIGRSVERFQTSREGDAVDAVALPSRFPPAVAPDGSRIPSAEVKRRFNRFLNGRDCWFDLEKAQEVSETGSAAHAFAAMREQDRQRSLEERARLLYVAMTRAQDLLILALDAGVGRGAEAKLDIDPQRDLTGRVLERILPAGADRLDAPRLVLANSAPGDFELICLTDFCYRGERYGSAAAAQQVASAESASAASGGSEPDGSASEAGICGADDRDTFTLVYPAPLTHSIAPAETARDCYSYTSMAAELQEAGEDRVADGERADRRRSRRWGKPGEEPPVDPTALGSAFHAAAQWLIEYGADTVPVRRLDALCRAWGLSASPRERLEAALARWQHSDVRRELLCWPVVRAEVAFFSSGMAEARERFGAYAQGAIDALGTDPTRPDRALVIDYKTGGSAAESSDELQATHELQARVYADVLRRSGIAHVTMKFVRVEIEDPSHAGQPQVIVYRFG
ncbi:UvrD/REP helicase [Coriobacterium glomerans PW2]|uniref:DNA 3'-5' helicase n=1 Tax=Coriobacterium glomerans (strain ATCC 49209 / DSM 20642 / JCM 10262 / PW2) TaxID=700015 RepID=F2NBK6_CORGP|nr:UvrD-helicase domain-containing protein [Coriobacterium glomerans]AEB06742.1 UvrD/REP helicase [Coriobacterium glomerans PW2]